MFYPASFRSNPETYTVLCIRGTDELMVKHWYLKPHLIQDSKPSHRVLWRLHLGVTKGWITVSGSVSERKSQSSQKAQRPKRNVWKSDQSAYLTCEGMPFLHDKTHLNLVGNIFILIMLYANFLQGVL